MNLSKFALVLVTVLFPASFALALTKVPPSVQFLEPKPGAVVGQKFKVKMGTTNAEIKPVGDMTAGTGHHHIIINKGPIKKGEVVPTDAEHLHFGKGQTETEVTLKPGKYKLTLQFADGAHRSYGPEMSSTIDVEVK